MFTTRRATLAIAAMLMLSAGAASAAVPRMMDPLVAARAPDTAPIHLAASGDDAKKGWWQRWQDKKRQEQENIDAARRRAEDKQRRDIENQELTRRLKQEREQEAHRRWLDEQTRKAQRDGCKYGRGKC